MLPFVKPVPGQAWNSVALAVPDKNLKLPHAKNKVKAPHLVFCNEDRHLSLHIAREPGVKGSAWRGGIFISIRYYTGLCSCAHHFS